MLVLDVKNIDLINWNHNVILLLSQVLLVTNFCEVVFIKM